jgi:hypothetical protein
MRSGGEFQNRALIHALRYPLSQQVFRAERFLLAIRNAQVVPIMLKGHHDWATYALSIRYDISTYFTILLREDHYRMGVIRQRLGTYQRTLALYEPITLHALMILSSPASLVPGRDLERVVSHKLTSTRSTASSQCLHNLQWSGGVLVTERLIAK